MFNILNLNQKIGSLFTSWISAFIILIIGLILGKLAGKFLRKILNQLKLNQILNSSTGVKSTFEETFSLALEYFIYFLALIFALDQLNITTTILNIISGALITFILISLLIAIKDFMPNLIAGIYILNRFKKLKQGITITINGITGKIKEISLVEIKLETKDKDIVYITNSNFLKGSWKINKN